MLIIPPPKPLRRSTKRDGLDPIDVHVGTRVRLRRTLLGLSQAKLAAAIGHTFQQVQKYEKGSNRISSSMLHRIAQVLHIPVSFFFDNLPEDLRGTSPTAQPDDLLTRPESLDLLRCYYQSPDWLRVHFLQLIKAVAKDGRAT